jgi:adenosylmethionine-8-amino-7-oxononanoate aminotransferase
MTEAAERLPFARRAAFENGEAAAYEAELLSAAGPGYARVFLTSSGSEAVDCALKIAYRYQCASGHPERRSFRFEPGHYHGATLGGLGVTGFRARRGPYEGLLPGAPAGPFAARILETIPAAGLGASIPEPGALARIRADCDASGALWIADEVLTGFGRTGSLFAWQRLAERREDEGAVPDLVVFGKGAGAGFAALGGVLVGDRVARGLDALPAGERFTHHQTYGGNPVACAVGRAVLRALWKERLFQRVRALEGDLAAAFGPLASRPPARAPRGLGYLLGVELAEGAEAARPFPPAARVAERVEEACRARGVLVYAARGWAPDGERGDFLLLAPPLVAGPEAFNEAGAAVAAAVAEVLPA